MRRVAFLALVALAAMYPATAGAAPRSAQTILVKFDKKSAAKRAVERLGDSIVGTTAGRVTVVALDRRDSIAAKVARYNKLPGVDYAERNRVRRAVLANPNDPAYSRQWGLAKIQAPAGWSTFPGSYAARDKVPIAILDTGIDSTHEDLDGGRVRLASGGDCSRPVGCIAGPALDDNGHGTHVAGIAAADTNNGTGVAGLAFDATLIPVKVLDQTGSGSDAAVANGIAWAVQHGARVISMSLGGEGGSQTVCDAITAAIGQRVVVVAAAGNNSSSTPFYPAACAGTIGVSATTSSDSLASYSNSGSPDVFVAAPGDQIFSTYKGDTYASLSGTSMAAPFVSALAALLIAEAPGRSVADVKTVLAQTSDKVGGGYGSDPYGTCSGCTWSASFGYGRINASRALAQSVPGADFGLVVTPGPLLAALGAVVRADVDVTSIQSFHGTVALAASGLPAGTVVHFQPASVSAPGQAQLVLTVPPTAPSGSYTVKVTGTSGSLTRSATFPLTVTGVTVPTTVPSIPPTLPSLPPDGSLPPVAVGPADFTLQVSPSEITRPHGAGATTILVRLSPVGAFLAPVSLSVSGLPTGAAAVFAPPLVTAPGEAVLTLTLLPTTTAGTSTLTITGTAGSITRSATVTLTLT